MTRLLACVRGALFRLAATRNPHRIQIAPGLELYGKLEIRGPGCVQIGRNCVVGRMPGNRSHYVTLYTHSSQARIVIGNDARLFAARISCKYSVEIGDNILIEEAGIRDTDFHSLDKGHGDPIGETIERCRVVIGNRVGIASRSMIAKGVTIGDDVVVGPGSIVIRSVPDRCFVIGNPARILEPRSLPTRLPR